MLPFEILDKIFSYLQADVMALKACSQAHSAFFRPAERYFYTHVTFCNKPCDNPDIMGPSFFSKLLSDRPHIVNHIEFLHLLVDQVTLWNNDCISSILPQLLNLRGVSLKPTRNRTRWGDLPDGFHAVFLACLRLPSMNEVTVREIHDFPLSAFSGCAIASLVLDGMLDNSEDHINFSYPQLETLQLIHCPSAGTFISKTMASNLRDFSFSSFREEEFPPLVEILRACSNSLIKLELNIRLAFHTEFDACDGTFTPPSIAFPSTLATLPLLEHLTIQLEMQACLDRHTSRPQYLFSLPTIVQLLQTASSSLKRVDLQVDLYIIERFSIEQVDWSPLTALLPLKSIHPINLCVSADFHHTPIDPAPLLHILERDADLSEMLRQGVLVLRTKWAASFFDWIHNIVVYSKLAGIDSNDITRLFES